MQEPPLPDTEESVRVAIVQAAPVFYDSTASAEKAAQLIGEAAETGAVLAAFGEGWIPGYPLHAFSPQTAEGWWDIAAEYLVQAVSIPGPVTDTLCEAASTHGIDVIIGVAERDPITNGTIYATQLIIGSEGTIVGRHRKLRANLHERIVWGDGDTAGLSIEDRGYGTVSTLSGWDNQMVLPLFALAEQGTQFHVASWPGGEPALPAAPAVNWPRQHLLSRAFAAQAGAFVLCAAGIAVAEDIPEKYAEFGHTAMSGDSVVIDPRGEIIAGPATGETILVADCDMNVLRAAKVAFDCAGHSGRPDQLHFRHSIPGSNDGQHGEGDYGDSYPSDGNGDDPYQQNMDGAPDQSDQQYGWVNEPPPGQNRSS